MYLDSSGLLRASLYWHGSINDQIVSSSAYNDNRWHLAVDTYDGTTERLYVDGSLLGSQTVSENAYTSSYAYFIGTGFTGAWSNGTGGWSYLNGTLDEVRESAIQRSAGWITTEYNNQSVPANFFTVGPIQ